MVGQKHILVAEDDPRVARVIRFTLERAGHAVTVAGDGKEAWRHLEDDTFDLLLTDQRMPEMTGSELCQQIRQDARLADMPVIMLTGNGYEDDNIYLREDLGVAMVFCKPFNPVELVAAIGRMMTCLVASGEQ